MRPITFYIQPARHAKGKMAVQTPSDDGWKSPAAYILERIAPNARWTNRERAYIVSPRQAARFEKLATRLERMRVSRELWESGK